MVSTFGARWPHPSLAIPLVVLSLWVFTRPCAGSSVTVPVDLPTIQQGIASSADTVLVATGYFDEDVVVDRGVVLVAAPLATPHVRGLSLDDAIGPSITVSGFRVDGQVSIRVANLEHVLFEGCQLDSGITGGQAGSIYVHSCLILGDVNLNTVAGISFSSNAVMGASVWIDGEGWAGASNNYVEGSAAIGLRVGNEAAGVSGNTVVGADIGILTRNAYTVTDNTVTDCSDNCFQSEYQVKYYGNTARRCGGNGFDLREHIGELVFSGNVVDRAAGDGVVFDPAYAPAPPTIEFNVVGRCGGHGFNDLLGTIRYNTVYLNGGSGFRLHGDAELTHNIAYGNQRYGVEYAGSSALLGCNDWFANRLGKALGVAPSPTDLDVDPMFCDLPADDVSLSAYSPLLDAVGCGSIGALDQGCEGPPVSVPTPADMTVARINSIVPNPLRGQALISFSLPQLGLAQLSVVDVQGREVARLADGQFSAGLHQLRWGAGEIAAGVYFVTLVVEGYSTTRSVAVVR